MNKKGNENRLFYSCPIRKDGGAHQRITRHPTASLQASLQCPSSGRENGKHRVAHKGTWNSCHPASPEEQQRNGLSVVSKAGWAVLRYRIEVLHGTLHAHNGFCYDGKRITSSSLLSQWYSLPSSLLFFWKECVPCLSRWGLCETSCFVMGTQGYNSPRMLSDLSWWGLHEVIVHHCLVK